MFTLGQSTASAVLAFLFVGTFVTCLVLGVNLSNKKKRRLYDEAERVYRQGVQVLENNYGVISFLPEDYWYPMATEYMAGLARANRVDTVREALSMCDEYIHRCRMERAQAQILANQQAQQAQLKSIRAAAWISAADAIARHL